MAFAALYQGVFACQRKSRFAMIKAGRRPPAVESVTCLTFDGELSPMFVEVTIATGPIKPNKRPIKVLLSCQKPRTISHVFSLMATAALKAGMLAFEKITGECMVEILLPAGPEYKLACRPQMFDMTRDTILVISIRVKPSPGLDIFGQQYMAIETFLGRNLLSGPVTILAVLQALKLRMYFVKRPGGQLAQGRDWKEAAK